MNQFIKNGVISIEVRINKEVRDYQESIFFGLSLRQPIFALLAVLVAVGTYFGLRGVVGSGEIGWMCVLAAFPFALGGFFTYNGIPSRIPSARTAWNLKRTTLNEQIRKINKGKPQQKW